MHHIRAGELPPRLQALPGLLVDDVGQRGVPPARDVNDLGHLGRVRPLAHGHHDGQVVEGGEARADNGDALAAQRPQRAAHAQVARRVLAGQDGHLHDGHVGCRVDQEHGDEDAVVPAALRVEHRVVEALGPERGCHLLGEGRVALGRVLELVGLRGEAVVVVDEVGGGGAGDGGGRRGPVGGDEDDGAGAARRVVEAEELGDALRQGVDDGLVAGIAQDGEGP